MRIERIAIDRINPAPYNPRRDLKPGDAEYAALERSLTEFGCVEPLVWNARTGNLVGGHQRFKVLVAQGAAALDVSVVDLNETREKALNLALNKIQGGWDERKLAELLDELSRAPDLDLGLTGFSLEEADELIASCLNESALPETFDPDEAYDATAEPATRPGDLIELGRHRVLCGDSASAADVRRALDGAPADLLFTDPPYNVAYDGGRPGTRGVAQKRIAGDDVEQGEYERWLEQVLAAACGSLRAGAAFYIWNGFRQFGPMVAALESAGGRVSAVLTWAKESFALGYGDYNQQTEFCIYGWMPAARGRHAWHGPPSESTLWRVARDAAGGPDAHPTRKPVELAERAINNSTRRNQTVLDCFLGGGSTLVAAERTGRRCVGIEIDPRWCDAAVRRWIALVGPNRAGHDLVERYAEARA